MTKGDDQGPPVGWAEWEAWQDSEECAKALRMIGDDLREMGLDMGQNGMWLGLSINHLASCAFAAGLELHELSTRDPGLEGLFLSLVAGDVRGEVAA